MCNNALFSTQIVTKLSSVLWRSGRSDHGTLSNERSFSKSTYPRKRLQGVSMPI